MSLCKMPALRLVTRAPARAGYVLAEMSVQQTRAHFLRKYGALVDRPEVGAHAYTALRWRLTCLAVISGPGLSQAFRACPPQPVHHNLVQQPTNT